MTFSRTVLLGALVWVSLITLLHATLNWKLFEAKSQDGESRPKFRVGFLPVT